MGRMHIYFLNMKICDVFIKVRSTKLRKPSIRTLLGQQDGSANKRGLLRKLKPEFDYWNPQYRRKEPTPQS